MLAYDWNFLGLSTETKPTAGEKVVDGSTFYECDTSTFYVFYNGNWYLQTFITEDGINFWLYKALMKKMFGKLFDSNITLAKIIKPTTGTEIEFTSTFPAQITDLTGYGDTTQQTYSGKNLFNKDATPTTKFNDSSLGVTPLTTGVRLTANASVTYSGAIYIIGKKEDYIGNTLTFTTHSKSSSTNNPRVYIGTCNSGGGNRAVKANETGNSGEYDFSLSWPVENDDSNEYICVALYTTASAPVSMGDYMDYTDAQLEVGSTSTPYEPYVGGTASPNPDYPQDIQTVTGEQTVTINGEQVYTIDLGSIELCKIGDYQDYIYKSGDDWYVHKETGKVILDGTIGAYNTTSNWYYAGVVTLGIPTPVTRGRIISNYFTESQANYMSNPQHLQENGLCAINSNTHIVCRNTDYSGSTADYQTWLGTTNPKFYYQLATPTDTKITDTTLIANLNSLLNYIFPVGEHQIVITADDLPMALKLIITEKE